MINLKEKISEKKPTLVLFEKAATADAVEARNLEREIARQFAGRADVVRVDASYNGNIKQAYRLEEYPTWILFKEGAELMRESGRKTLGELADMVQRGL